MNSPTHVIAGALIAQGVMIYRDRHAGPVSAVLCGVTTIVAGMVSHLALDALPHYDWIVYLNWFPGLSGDPFLCEALCTVPMSAVGWYAGREHPVILGLGMFSAMYPDFEKVAYLVFYMPQQLVIFRAHSLRLSIPHYYWPRPALIALELAIAGGSAAATLWLAAWRRRR